jgi:hypothetical protein
MTNEELYFSSTGAFYNTSRKANFFVSSQPEADIAATYSSWKAIHLKPCNLGLDKRTNIHFRIVNTDCDEFISMCKSAVIKDIKQTLTMKA